MEKRKVGYDILRIISIIMVVMIHSHVATLSVPENTFSWISITHLTALCVTCVPIFFMLSGALLLNGNVCTLKELYTSRIPKQAIPFVIWSLVYVFVRIALSKIPFSISSFTSLTYEPAYYQFWFMYTLFAIYLLLPLLQTLVNNISAKHYIYVLVIWAVFSSIIPLASRYIPGFAISKHVDLILCEGYIGYFLLGGYIKKYCQSTKPQIFLMLFVLGTLITQFAVFAEWNYSLSFDKRYIGDTVCAYLYPGALISATGLFGLLQNVKITVTEKSRKIIAYFSRLTMGVFYTHMLVLTFFEYTIFANRIGFFATVIKTVLTVVCSFVFAAVVDIVKCFVAKKFAG